MCAKLWQLFEVQPTGACVLPAQYGICFCHAEHCCTQIRCPQWPQLHITAAARICDTGLTSRTCPYNVKMLQAHCVDTAHAVSMAQAPKSQWVRHPRPPNSQHGRSRRRRPSPSPQQNPNQLQGHCQKHGAHISTYLSNLAETVVQQWSSFAC